MVRIILIFFMVSQSVLLIGQTTQSLNNTKFNGYRGIWFELNQKYEYGDKYSGALGTYTAKHVPMAIYSSEVNKTFFVYGGTKSDTSRYLLCMIGEFDHKTGKVSRPTVVCDKEGVDDPHDNPSIMIDDAGYIWVFVSGRGRRRSGFKFRSKKPFDIDTFEMITKEEMTYPQPWNTSQGFLHLFTKYTGVRQLYFETSKDGVNWTEDKMLAAIPVNKGEKSGHYQTSRCFNDELVGTFFNRHPGGNVDKRTDLYYLQTSDFGKTWKSADGVGLEPPLLNRESPARAVNYASKDKNVYLKDMGFDSEGNPLCLYICSDGHKPGPVSKPYEWCITRWDGQEWQTTVITESDHNYDMGSLFISEEEWKIVAPTIGEPQKWGVGGELEVWKSKDRGENWSKIRQITKNSRFNHSYVRSPINYKAPFCFFWGDGHPHKFSKSQLYFGDFEGNVWRLPYEMENGMEKPVKVR